MSIVIDGIIFSLQPYGGISAYFREMIRRLDRDRHETNVSLYLPALQDLDRGGTNIGAILGSAQSRILERYRHCIVEGKLSSEAVFHSSYYRQPSRRIPSIVTVYDFTYEKVIRGPRKWLHSFQKLAAIRSASIIICISNSTRDDLRAYVGERPGQDVRVIHLAASEEFRPMGTGASERPYVLFVGHRGGYKNFKMVVQALASLPDLDLVCVGGTPLRPHELAYADRSVRERVRYLGSVPDARLNELYNQAACLAYPTSHEGFGMPVLEAMQAGCPVVATKCKAVLEVAGDALTVAESDPVDLARCILRVTSPSYRADKVQIGLLIAGKYSWKNTYQETLDLYRRLM